MQGLKHLVQCRCFLPQFKRLKNPPKHQFPVFSVIDDNNNVCVKYAQCTNCGVIHKVDEISSSTIIANKEHMGSLVSIDEIRGNIDDRLSAILDSNHVDISTWEEVQYVIENSDWGRFITLNKDVDGDEVHIKVLRILGPHMFKVSNEIRDEYARET